MGSVISVLAEVVYQQLTGNVIDLECFNVSMFPVDQDM